MQTRTRRQHSSALEELRHSASAPSHTVWPNHWLYDHFLAARPQRPFLLMSEVFSSLQYDRAVMSRIIYIYAVVCMAGIFLQITTLSQSTQDLAHPWFYSLRSVGSCLMSKAYLLTFYLWLAPLHFSGIYNFYSCCQHEHFICLPLLSVHQKQMAVKSTEEQGRTEEAMQ